MIDFKKMSTKSLLAMRSYSSGEDEDVNFQTALRIELNTREHVPSPKEARDLRSKSTSKKKTMKFKWG